MVTDGAGWHRSHSLRIFVCCYCQPYSPELNPVEHLWYELREKNFHTAYSTASARSNLIWSMPFNVWRKLLMW
jgi:transposase